MREELLTRIVFLNPAALEILGYTDEEELLGRPSHETIHYLRPDGSPFPAEDCPLLRPRVAGETVRVDQDWFVRKDRSRVVVSYSSAPVDLIGGRGAVVAFRDISDRLRLGEVEAPRARIVAAGDETRRRIERDLHDGAQQRVVVLGLELHSAAAMAPDELDVRTDDRLPDRIEVAAYYIVSEALANTAKHSQASVVHVELDAEDSIVQLAIRDDGVGGADPAQGSGLVGLSDRVEALGGKMDVASPAGRGTSLLVRIPIAPSAP